MAGSKSAMEHDNQLTNDDVNDLLDFEALLRARLSDSKRLQCFERTPTKGYILRNNLSYSALQHALHFLNIGPNELGDAYEFARYNHTHTYNIRACTHPYIRLEITNRDSGELCEFINLYARGGSTPRTLGSARFICNLAIARDVAFVFK